MPRTSSGRINLDLSLDLDVPHKALPSSALASSDIVKKTQSQGDAECEPSRQQDRQTLKEYCKQSGLTLTSYTGKTKAEFSVTMTGTPSSHFLRTFAGTQEVTPMAMALSESGRVEGKTQNIIPNKDLESENEDVAELATQKMKDHFKERLGWKRRTLRPTSMWSERGILVKLDPTKPQFHCEVGHRLGDCVIRCMVHCIV